MQLDEALIDAFVCWSRASQDNSELWIKRQRKYLAWWSDQLTQRDLRTLSAEKDVVAAIAGVPGRRQRLAVLKRLYSWLRKVRREISAAEDPTLDLLLMPPPPSPEKPSPPVTSTAEQKSRRRRPGPEFSVRFTSLEEEETIRGIAKDLGTGVGTLMKAAVRCLGMDDPEHELVALVDRLTFATQQMSFEFPRRRLRARRPELVAVPPSG